MPEPLLCRYVVASPLLHPVAARVGDVIVVRPGHETHPIAVVRRIADEWTLIRVGPPNYGAIILREAEGALIQLTASSSSLAGHTLLRSA